MSDQGKDPRTHNTAYLLVNVLSCEGEDPRTGTPDAPVYVEVRQDERLVGNIDVGEPNQTVRLVLEDPDSVISIRVMQPGREVWTEEGGQQVRASMPKLGSISFQTG